jgi:transcriptional regulator with XRE-family HTH domain
MDQYIIAENLCQLCKERHISVNALAEAIGKSPRQVNRYRNGQFQHISLDTLAKIADVLHVNVAKLFDRQI